MGSGPKKKLGLLTVLLILLIPSYVNARSLDLSTFRPDLASIPDRGLSISLPLVPYFGTPNIFDVAGIKTYTDIYSNMGPPPFEGDVWAMFHVIDCANRLKGHGAKLDILLLPSLSLSINSKYLEFYFSGIASGYMSMKIRGLEKELDITDLVLTESGPNLALGEQKIFSYKNGYIIGFETWFIGKTPIKVKNTVVTPLLGVGFTFGYNFSYTYNMYSYESVSITDGIYYDQSKNKEWIMDLGGLVGIQWETKKLTSRLVIQSANLFSLHPEFDLGLSVDVKNTLTASTEIRNFSRPRPTFLFELSRSFGKNSEVAVGLATNSNIIARDFGYLNLSFGGKIVRATTTFIFNDKQFGVLIGTNIGYYP